MGKRKKGGQKATKTKHISSGLKKIRAQKRLLNELQKKVERWKHYKDLASKTKPGKSRGNWNTKGMEDQIDFIKKLRGL